MGGIAFAYMSGVVGILVVATSIEEEIGLKPILLAAFGWPVFGPLLAWKASRRA